MKKVLFVDHDFHVRTRSADFFSDLLRKKYKVQPFYLSPGGRLAEGLIEAASRCDLVILWQMDFLAPVFIALGKPTFVIPMYDGSNGMPDIHWLFAYRARFFNFSLILHERIRMLGAQSLLLRYFPEPAPRNKIARFDGLSALFWQRRPDHGVTTELVNALIGQDLDHLHLHDAPDLQLQSTFDAPADARYTFKKSEWFSDRREYVDILERSNVFVAPRPAEGIGLALLDAMSRGMLVLAHDAPTNNEYISNWINGILFNKDASPEPIRIRPDARRLGYMAWRTVVEGRRAWIESESAVFDWLDQGSIPEPLNLNPNQLLGEIWESYYSSNAEYESFLRRKIGILDKLCPLPFSTVLGLIGQRSTLSVSPNPARDHDLDNRAMDLTRRDDKYIGRGWSHAEHDRRWALGTLSELKFSGLDVQGQNMKATFEAASLAELGESVHCVIAVNDQFVFEAEIVPTWSKYAFNIPSSILRSQNSVTLTYDKASITASDNRYLSVAFKRFEFEPSNIDVELR